eukprot:243734_1
MPISAFGIWAAIVIAINYLLMITYFPACVSYYFQYVQKHETIAICFPKKEQEKKKRRRSSVSVQQDYTDSTDDITDDENEQKPRNLFGHKNGAIKLFLGNVWCKWMIQF